VTGTVLFQLHPSGFGFFAARSFPLRAYCTDLFFPRVRFGTRGCLSPSCNDSFATTRVIDDGLIVHEFEFVCPCLES
jgi:hypothetical protein